MAFINLSLIVLSLAMPDKYGTTLWIVKSDNRFLSLVFILNIAAWLLAIKLLKFEYKRRLSEAYYSH